MRDFSEGSNSTFVEPPVPCAYMKWIRGDAKLATLKKTDPAAFYGGWRAFLSHKDKGTDAQIENPKLPLPVVQRVSDDGQHGYQVYATNVLNFLPIQFRLRYEYRKRITDQQTGRETEKVVATSKNHQPGYQPNKQLFGLVFGETDEYAPAILFISNWSGFISMNKAADVWKKVKWPEGKILIRRYGSIGVADSKGNSIPCFETFGQGRSTPIEAIGVDKPRFIADNPVFDKLFDDSIAWKECPRWNAEGKTEGEMESNQYLEAFDAKVKEIGLTNIEVEQLLKEAKGDYQRALAMMSSPEVSEDEINAELSKGDRE